ncbi:hypothetical protein [Symbiopectobacterium purcellii]|uniref:hypothetical protein n=1 Tax=Symbiopectobacterium purcellii TaxID=2871826 RepID=UPI003F85A720
MLGYHSFVPGIGGGRLFVSDDSTSADDGFTCFVTTDGVRIKWSVGQSLTVQMAGAVGDGVHIHEDTSAFQRAADAGVSVLVPKPREFYGINDSSEWKGIIPANSGTHFYGDGSYPEIRLMASRCNIFSNFIRDFTLTAIGPITDFKLEGLYLNSNNGSLADPVSASFLTGDNYSFGVYMIKCANVTLRNCRFKNSWYGGHNLFSVQGQTVENCHYENIGPANAHFANYAAMGSDADWRVPNQNVTYINNEVKNCGGVLRGNNGVNNGAVSESKSWRITGTKASDTKTGIDLYNGAFTNVSITNTEMTRCTNGRCISVSGRGSSYNRDTPIKNISIKNTKLIDCLTANVSKQAYIYAFASDGLVEILETSIVGGNGGGGSNNDGIVMSGEQSGGSAVAKGLFIVDGAYIKTDAPLRNHVRHNMAANLIGRNVTHASLSSSYMWFMPSGGRVDISDGSVTAAGLDTSLFVKRNWAHGSVRNIQGVKTSVFA